MKKPANSQPVFGESGAGCTFLNTGNGISVNLNLASKASRRAPLTVYLGSENNAPRVFVHPGTVNGFIPKINSTFIDQLPAPTLNAAAGIVYVKVQRVNNTPFPANVTIEQGNAVPADDSTFGHYALASVTSNNGKLQVFNYVLGNLQCHRLSVAQAPTIYYWAII